MRRSLLLCVVTAVLLAALTLPAYSAVELYRVAATTPAPAFITFTLNCPASVTIEIDQIADEFGNPVGPTLTFQETKAYATKGDKVYVWPCTKNVGGSGAAPAGTYQARIYATKTQASWDRIIGLYLNCDYFNEYPPRPLPSTPDLEGQYGIGVNKTSTSSKYGYIYTGRKPDGTKDVFVYDPGGKNVGTLDDSTINWGTSSPWGVDVADDGYIYVGDRSNTWVHCFDPDGNYVSTSGFLAFFRGMEVRQDTGGVTHLFGSGSTRVSAPYDPVVYEITVAANHTTWTGRTYAYYPPGDTAQMFGMWVSPSLQVIYQCAMVADPNALTKWIRQPAGNYLRDNAFVSNVGPCVDVEMSSDGTFLWVTTQSAYSIDEPTTTIIEATVTAIRKVDVATGQMIPVNKAIKTVNPVPTAAGAGYTVGNILTVTEATGGSGGTVNVTAVGGSGEVTAITLNAGGNGYSTGAGKTTTGGTGTGCTVEVTEVYPLYDVISYGLMNARDGVGNIAITFGKSTTTWAQKFWGLFAEAGSNTTSTRTTSTFVVTADPAPVVVPETETWSNFSDANYPGKIFPNGVATAKVTFEVIDAQGQADIGTITLDLTELGGGAAVAPDTSVPHGTDPLKRVCTKTVTAVNGTRCDRPLNIPVTVCDVHVVTPRCNTDTFHVSAAGNRITGTVKHIRWATFSGGSYTGGLVQGANVKAYGGKVGVSGHPFTYTSPLTDASGLATMDASEGIYEVYAYRLGFKTQVPWVAGVNVPVPASPQGPAVIAGDVLLGPVTIAECKALPPATLASVEGVCFAQPKGEAPTAAYGLDYRTNSSTGGTTPDDTRRGWYLCDANTPAEGLLFMLRRTGGLEWPYTYDDPNAKDPDFENPWYIGVLGVPGARPAVGDTLCVTGTVGTIGGWEKRVMCKEDFEAVPDFKNNWLNRGNIGGLPASPVSLTIPQIYHGSSTPDPTKWGKYGQVANATVVFWSNDGKQIDSDKVIPAGALPFALISNPAGNWATVTFHTCASLNIPWTSPAPPTGIDIGDTYTFTGATGRRARYGEGTIRVRGSSDFTMTYDYTAPTAHNVADIRGVGQGGAVNIRGIVTRKWTGSFIYVESADRSAGVRVISSPYYVDEGDEVGVVGTIDIASGEKMINPTMGIIEFSAGNTIPAAFSLTTRDFGGKDYGPNDPGVPNGRGALNLGLVVNLSGMVTYRDPGGTYFYIWDGANSVDTPVQDSLAIAKGVRVYSSLTVVPWEDWVEVTGIASTTLVSGTPVPVIRGLSAAGSVAEVITFDAPHSDAGAALTAQWNLVALPAAPANSAGAGSGEFDAKPWDPYIIFAPTQIPDEIDGRMYRLEQSNQSMYLYDMWSEPQGPFGGNVIGDGYWLRLDDTAWAVDYSAKISTLDEWNSLCVAGWMLAGQPKLHHTYWADCKVHDGAQIKSLYDAAVGYGAGWLSSIGYWFDNSTQSMIDIGLPDDYPTTDILRPWHGYWFQVTNGDRQRSLIVPDSPVAPPP